MYMLRCFLVFVSASMILLSSCATTDSGVLASGSRRADIVEALSSERPEDNKIDLALELPFADTVRNAPQPQIETAEPEVSEEVEEIPAEIQENTDTEAVELSPAEAVPVPETAVSAEENVPEEEIISVTADAAISAEPEAEAVMEPEMPELPSESDESVPAFIEEEIPLPQNDNIAEVQKTPSAVHPAVAAPRTMPAAMSRIIVDAMIASVVIVIMFTVATAIRSAYKMPLSYLLSAVIALLISFLPFVICIIIGGMSKVWYSYFLLLLSFFIFRSGKGRRDFR